MAIKPKEAYELDDRQLKYIAEAEKTIDKALNEQPEGVDLLMERLSPSKKCHGPWWSNNRAAREKLKSIYTEAGWFVYFEGENLTHFSINILTKQKGERIFEEKRAEEVKAEKRKRKLEAISNGLSIGSKLFVLVGIIVIILNWWQG